MLVRIEPVNTLIGPLARSLYQTDFNNSIRGITVLAELSMGCNISADISLLAVIWTNTSKSWRMNKVQERGTSVSQVITRDGMLYFGALLVLNIAKLVFFFASGHLVVAPFVVVLRSILSSRFILNLRWQDHKACYFPEVSTKTQLTYELPTRSRKYQAPASLLPSRKFQLRTTNCQIVNILGGLIIIWALCSDSSCNMLWPGAILSKLFSKQLMRQSGEAAIPPSRTFARQVTGG
ncbi:hypothetical protein BC629DRAFT_978170 [Irpex lacteus]|nr:hypothetical protein BC629DRAFT_978170 [Irpex lacteus]